MKTNPEALKALYVAAGGDASAVADAVTTVDVLNAIAVLFGGDGDATTNPDAIDNITAVYKPGNDALVNQQDTYNANKFIAQTDGVLLVVGGTYNQLSAGETLRQIFVKVKAPKGKTLAKVFEYVPEDYTMSVTDEGVTVTNGTAETGSPIVFAIYRIS